MKKKKIFLYILISFMLIASLLLYLKKDIIFQRGNPVPYVQNMFLLNGDTRFVDVFDDDSTYITKINEEDELFQYIENEYGVSFQEQIGSGYLFKSDTTRITLTSQIYWRYYKVWDVNVTIDLTYTSQPYLETKLPTLDETVKITEVGRFELDDIMQIFYTKDDDMSYYSYLEINDIKYDLGPLTYNLSSHESKDKYQIVKTMINHSQPIYKVNIISGANSLESLYFRISNNVPEQLCLIPFSEEINNYGEFMTISSYGTLCTTYMYRWKDNELYVYDFNKSMNCMYVRYYSDSMSVEAIETIDYSQSSTFDTIVYKLKGETLIKVNK